MKVSFIAGVAVGYVLGARAGRQRYEQIRRTSEKVWNSGPVQRQVGTAKEAARTKAAPMVADLVADAARATGEKLRSSRTVRSEAVAADASTPPRHPLGDSAVQHSEPGSDATAPRPLG
ncbi:MAG: protoporphyrinogen oxidase [Dermatophilaceae bacterium]